jgi:hypothetical protein
MMPAVIPTVMRALTIDTMMTLRLTLRRCGFAC